MSDTGFQVVSGGQTGVDRAALDAARERGLAIGGWCPLGRTAEDGPIAADYPLRETDSADPAVRTRANVSDSDATLVLTTSTPDHGTRLTIDIARAVGKPLLVVDVDEPDAGHRVQAWLASTRPRRLNVAGLRESSAPGIYRRALALLLDVFRNVAFDDDLDQRAGR